MLNSHGISGEGNDNSIINFVNIDNIFCTLQDVKLTYEDYSAVTEDFATMHVNEDILDQLEEFGYS